EFMNHFASEPYRSFVIRILEKQLFILIFVLRQKPHSHVWSCSLRRNFDCMAVRITHEKCFAKVELFQVMHDYTRRYKLHSCCAELGRCRIHIWCHQNRLSMDKIVRVLINRERAPIARDRKSTRLNSSHLVISYAVFCLKKKIDDSLITILTPPDLLLCSFLGLLGLPRCAHSSQRPYPPHARPRPGIFHHPSAR